MDSSTLSSLGVPGLVFIVIVEAGIIAKLFFMVLAEKDKRIDGAEKLRDDIALRDKYMQEAMQLTTSKIRVSKEAQDAQAS